MYIAFKKIVHIIKHIVKGRNDSVVKKREASSGAEHSIPQHILYIEKKRELTSVTSHIFLSPSIFTDVSTAFDSAVVSVGLTAGVTSCADAVPLTSDAVPLSCDMPLACDVLPLACDVVPLACEDLTSFAGTSVGLSTGLSAVADVVVCFSVVAVAEVGVVVGFGPRGFILENRSLSLFMNDGMMV